MSLDKGEVSKFSTKKYINGKRSTKDELIGVDNNTDKIICSIDYI